jgi:hypothetical protein
VEGHGLKRHAVLLVLAIGLLAIAFAVTIVQNAFGVRLPGIDFPLLILGTIAVTFSLPLVTVAILLTTRRNLREAWRTGDAPARRVFQVFLAIEAVGAVIAWTVFVLAITHG